MKNKTEKIDKDIRTVRKIDNQHELTIEEVWKTKCDVTKSPLSASPDTVEEKLKGMLQPKPVETTSLNTQHAVMRKDCGRRKHKIYGTRKEASDNKGRDCRRTKQEVDVSDDLKIVQRGLSVHLQEAKETVQRRDETPQVMASCLKRKRTNEDRNPPEHRRKRPRFAKENFIRRFDKEQPSNEWKQGKKRCISERTMTLNDMRQTVQMNIYTSCKRRPEHSEIIDMTMPEESAIVDLCETAKDNDETAGNLIPRNTVPWPCENIIDQGVRLNDSHIDGFISNAVLSEYGQQQGVFSLGCFFMRNLRNLADGWDDPMIQKLFRDGDVQARKRPSGRHLQRVQKLPRMDAPVLIMPTFVGAVNGGHWYAVVRLRMEDESTVFLYMNSLESPEDETDAKNLLRSTPLWNTATFRRPRWIRMSVTQQVRQDCGPWTCFNILALIRAWRTQRQDFESASNMIQIRLFNGKNANTMGRDMRRVMYEVLRKNPNAKRLMGDTASCIQVCNNEGKVLSSTMRCRRRK